MHTEYWSENLKERDHTMYLECIGRSIKIYVKYVR
jgi:hypothetical protein